MKTNIIFMLSDNIIAQIVGDSMGDAPTVGDTITFDEKTMDAHFVDVQLKVVKRVVSYGKQINHLPGINTVLVFLEFVN